MGGMHVHAVDGTYELFRAYFGAPEAKTPSGREIGAVRALARSMLRLVRVEGATHIGIAFDHTVESFRNDLFDGYKSGEGLEPELDAQFQPAEDICKALGFVVWPMVEFEADDALATAAARYGADPQVKSVRLCTPDKDLAQCVQGERIVTVDRRRNLVFDETGVRVKFGIEPASMPDYLALVGDPADGIPGIPRWGAKSAAAVLAEYRHLEEIPDDPETWSIKVRGATALALSLAGMREEATLYRELATLRTDAPLTESVADLRWCGPDLERLQQLCEELGDRSLVERARAVPIPER
jgi:5'-3' exonuclease